MSSQIQISNSGPHNTHHIGFLLRTGWHGVRRLLRAVLFILITEPFAILAVVACGVLSAFVLAGVYRDDQGLSGLLLGDVFLWGSYLAALAFLLVLAVVHIIVTAILGWRNGPR
ncbi:MAG: hypothetical protein ACYTF1_25830 [Planctomycetota bacterium]|jgi:hypothetical protein